MHLVESSSTEASSASKVPQSRGTLILKEAKLLCFCSKIDLDRYLSEYLVQTKTNEIRVIAKTQYYWTKIDSGTKTAKNIKNGQMSSF